MNNSNSSGLLGLLLTPSWLLVGLASLLAFCLGWFGMGWGLWPIEWVDASPAYLRGDVQRDYVRMTANTYATDLNLQQAATRIAALGATWPQIMDTAAAESQGADQARVTQLKQTLETLNASGQMPAPAPGPGSAGGFGSLLLPLVCALLVGAVLLVGGVLYFRNRAAAGPAFSMGGRPVATETALAGEADMDGAVVEARGGVAAGSPAIARFMSTYTLGDDAYDDSFSIDGPDGNFLGECGMGISETIGVGDPKKVTAFEVWLFDKNDIRTVTKVIMSEHAFNDEALKSRLAAKGEPVVARPGDTISLETATLIVDARIVDMAYGGGALPQSSFFERLTVELQARRKPQTA